MNEREIWVDGNRYFILREGARMLVQADTGKLRTAYVDGGTVRFADPDPGSDSEISHAPWSDEEVESLQGYQECGYYHEFTGTAGSLIPTTMGWVEAKDGPIVQTWAHKGMTNGSWKQHPFYKYQRRED